MKLKILFIVVFICTLLFILNGGVHYYFKFFPFWKYDKLMHGLLYFSTSVFTTLMLSTYTKEKALRIALFWFTLGFVEEVRQSFTDRGFSILDIISNFVGILIAYYLIKLLYAYKENRKKPLPD